MIRMIQSVASGAAKKYFKESLTKADYYINDQELKGQFFGKLKDRLGISEEVTKDVFFKLCDNINPLDGSDLTARTVENRRVGYDINFHCPKSVSIIHSLSSDEHILKLFQSSVRDTMKEIEKDAATRVRKSGQSRDRKTGELVWAEFVHQTARPTEGHAPDPHLHAHCFVFNATWDNIEKEFKAGQFGEIKRDMPYYQAMYQKILSDRLIEAGYNIRRTKSSFEIVGVPPSVIAHFSKRTNEIGQIAREKGITDAKELDKLGAMTRGKKEQGMSMAALREDWKRQILEIEQQSNQDHFYESDKPLRFTGRRIQQEIDWVYNPKVCVKHSIEKGFERASALPTRRLKAESYRHAIGEQRTTIQAIDEEIKNEESLIHLKEKTQDFITTREVLSEEYKMVSLAKDGIGVMKPIYKKLPKINLDGQQLEAVSDVLTNQNRVSIIRGAAGTGKTTLMKEAVEKITQAGLKVQVVAPTAQASRGVLKEEGFEDSETVAKFLSDEDLQYKVRGQVLWVDEAGLLGTQDMTKILELTQKLNARLILGGDTRQHSSVVRGDALRILNTVGGIKSSEVNRIYRQKNEQYKQAVESLSRGWVDQAFIQLDDLGFIHETNPEKPNEDLVNDYVDAIKKKKTALVISPTHKHGKELTSEIRKELRARKLIGKRDVKVTRLANLNFTKAEKADTRNYLPGMVIQVNRNTSEAVRGTKLTIDRVENNHLIVKNKRGEPIILPISKNQYYDVYRREEIGLSIGDKVIVTRNKFDKEKNRMNNGQELMVKKVTNKGGLKLVNPISKKEYNLDKEDLHLTHGHVITSHASQGKTVDQVFISQPAETFPATDSKQFYVSVSRARDQARIYTNDKQQLLQAAMDKGERKSAIELVNQNRGNETFSRSPISQPDKQKQINQPQKQRGYEPEI